MIKKGFTFIEIMIVCVMIGILITITSFGYIHIVNKTKTEKNQYLAEECIQSIERFKGLNPTGSRYPTINEIGNPTDFSDKDQEFKELLSKELKERLTFSKKDSDKNKKKIRFESCIMDISNSGIPEIPVGARIYYWDYVNKKYIFKVIGKTDKDGTIDHPIACINAE